MSNADKIYNNTPTITTDRLVLRRFTPDDIEAFFSIMSDERVNTFLPWFPTKTIAEAMALLDSNFLSRYALPRGNRYAVCLKSDNFPIGYVNVSEGDSHDFGYGLRHDFWNMGIVSEAAAAVISHMQNCGYPYITATHDINNPNSGKVMSKIGMKYQYSYVERWMPKDFDVTFRMYQLNFDGSDKTYMEYWDKYPQHFIEDLV